MKVLPAAPSAAEGAEGDALTSSDSMAKPSDDFWLQPTKSRTHRITLDPALTMKDVRSGLIIPKPLLAFVHSRRRRARRHEHSKRALLLQC
jgi:hypothetical protein